MSARPRLELKYRLDAFAYRRLQAAVRAQLRLDRHSRAAGGRYPVRSLYFDTSDLAAYTDKMIGLPTRVKPRLRAYGHRLEDAPFVTVELKARLGMTVVKESTRIDAATYRDFAARGSFEDAADDPVLAAFERVRRRGLLRPSALVAYRREAYESRAGRADPLRVTFDHRVESARAERLFDTVRWRAAAPSAVVLEIKTPSRVPPWLERLVLDHGLYSEPNSKYTQAIEQTFPALVLR